jgi:hypothetical protein
VRRIADTFAIPARTGSKPGWIDKGHPPKGNRRRATADGQPPIPAITNIFPSVHIVAEKAA